MIKKGDFVRVMQSADYYGIPESLYEAAHNFGPVRVADKSGISAILRFPDGCENRAVLSGLLWPLNRLEECENEEQVYDPDRDALFDMIGL